MRRPKKHPRYRAKFRAAFHEHSALTKEYLSFGGHDHPLYRELARELQRAIREKRSKQSIVFSGASPYVKWDFAKAKKILGEKTYQRIVTPFRDRADRLSKKNRREFKKIEGLLYKLAPLVPIYQSFTETKLIRLFSASTYSTQPASVNYARQRCEIEYEYLTSQLKVPLNRIQANRGFGVEFQLVGCLLEELDVKAIRYAYPGPDMVTFVRSCWQKGVNPRVFNPFIPYGFEERHGFDYYGRELKAST